MRTKVAIFFLLISCICSISFAQDADVQKSRWLRDTIFRLEHMRDKAIADIEKYEVAIQRNEGEISNSDNIAKLAQQEGNVKAETFARKASATAREAKMRNTRSKTLAELNKKRAETAIPEVKKALSDLLAGHPSYEFAGPLPTDTVHPGRISEEQFAKSLNSTQDQDEPLDAPMHIYDFPDNNPYWYAKVINQFKVETSKRYKPIMIKDPETGELILDKSYCNVFARDVAFAMGAKLPAFSTANKMVSWLEENGEEQGWHKITLSQDANTDASKFLRANAAQSQANEGMMTIGIIRGKGEMHGHVVVLRPGSLITPEEPTRGPAINQAGAEVLDAAHLGVDKLEVIQYWYYGDLKKTPETPKGEK